MSWTTMFLNTDSANASLRELIRADHEHIEFVAEEWFQKGYGTFSIWGDELAFYWPPAARDEVEMLMDAEKVVFASIHQGEQIVGKMMITGGAKTSLAQDTLDSQASIISSYLTMKAKFEQAALELVTQAQLKTEIDMAAQIQRRLLPEKLPEVEGLDMYAYSRAAQHVGGDFYDFFFSENCIIFVVGDISGKGLPAALFMVMARIVFRTAAHALSTTDPKDILACANENLYEDFTDVGLLATAFVGCYDPHKRQLTYTNGAHSPIMYCPKGGPPRFLNADSLPLGVLPTTIRLSHTHPFVAGDLLVIGTDGLNECRNMKGEMFGNDHLLKIVGALVHLPANQIGNELFETITVFAEGAHQLDDQTLIVIKGV